MASFGSFSDWIWYPFAWVFIFQNVLQVHRCEKTVETLSDEYCNIKLFWLHFR